MFGSVLLGITASLGTGIQAIQAAGDVRRQDREVFAAYEAVEALRTEFKLWRNPVKWFRQRRVLRSLLGRDSVERHAWRAVNLRLWSWALLWGAALLGTVDAVIAAVARLAG